MIGECENVGGAIREEFIGADTGDVTCIYDNSQSRLDTFNLIELHI